MKTFAVHFVAIAGQQAGPGGARRKAISVFTKSGPRWKPKTNIVMPSSPVAASKVAPAGPVRAAANGVGVGVR